MIQSATEAAASVESLVARVTDEFAEALARGDCPSIDAYASQYPQIAALLRRILPAIESLQKLSADGGETEGLIGVPSMPRELGDFRILGEIGRGGMGIVYQAEQISLRRIVALKVLLYAGLLDEKQLQRFKNEARAAATLEHPHIVPVYSIGCERGVHYFAMRYIEGQSLADVLQAIPAYDTGMLDGAASQSGRAPSMAIKLTCDASSRSIPNAGAESSPPSDGLETRPEIQAAITTDGTGKDPMYFQNLARLGIQAADALAYAHERGILHRDVKPGNLLLDLHGQLWMADFGLARLEQDAGVTMTGDVLGTLRYMSPEQALGQREAIDARSDVYSLGATLYEMLVLRPAFAGRDRQAILRRIATEEPQPPRRINPRIPRDLETIVLKAMSKEPSDRYATAQQLADDLRRYLDHIPIKAKPPTRREQLVKWSRRHPAVVWAVIFVLLIATALSAGSALLVTHAYRQALANAKRSEAISNFLTDAFRSPDPERDGRTITIAEVLDRAVRDLQIKFVDDPRTKAELLEAISQTYSGLGLYQEMIPLSEQVFTLRGNSLGHDHPDTLKSMDALAVALPNVGQYDKAVLLAKQALDLRRSTIGHDDPDTLMSVSDLAIATRSALRFDDLVQLDQDLLKLRQARLGRDHSDTLRSMIDLAFAYMWVGRTDEAVHLADEALSLLKARPGRDHRDTIRIMGRIASAYYFAGRPNDRFSLNKELLQLCRSTVGPTDPLTLQTMHFLAESYLDAREYDEGVRLYEEAVKLRTAILGLNHRDTLESMHKLVSAYSVVGRLDEAVHLQEETLRLRTANLGPKHVDTISAAMQLARVLTDQGDFAAAESHARDALSKARATLAPDATKLTGAIAGLARVLLFEKQFAEAEMLARESLQIREKRPLQPNDWRVETSRALLGGALLGQARYREAEPVLVSACEGLCERDAILPADRKSCLVEAFEQLVQLYEATGESEKAALFRAELTKYKKRIAPRADATVN